MVDEKILFDDEDLPIQTLKISPTDIIQKEFSVHFRGYDINQVDNFLEELAKELNQVLEENTQLKEAAHSLQQELTEYRENEKTLYDALAAAKQIGGAMQENARNEASLIISGARLDAEKVIAEVRQQCAVLQQEINGMLQKRAQFETSLRSLLETYLGMLGGERRKAGE